MRSESPCRGDVLELRVALRDIEPAVWRQLRVPAHLPLESLHEVLQIAFGWQNYHLHEFEVGDIRFGMAEGAEEESHFLVDERAAPLGAVARAGSALLYRYDFGDDWEHEITVVRVDPRGDPTVRCTGGARACPPEDCGGPHGYAHMLEALADRKHEGHADAKEWMPRGFDPEKFDAAAVTRKLAPLSKRLARGASRAPRTGRRGG